MKPLLKSEVLLNLGVLNQAPIDIVKAVLLLQAVWQLKDSPFPIDFLTVDMFRGLIGAEPHPDSERGSANLLDPDVVKDGDSVVSAEALLKVKADLELNNAGLLERGELKQQYAKLYELLGEK